MLASSNVCLSAYSSNQERPEFLAPERANYNLRRNFISLFDSMKTEVVRLDVSLGISLLDRLEQERVSAKLERAHPIIP